jgi:hypothetical protein
MSGPTQHAVDGWVRARKITFFKLIVFSVSLVGFPHPPLTRAGRPFFQDYAFLVNYEGMR